MVNSSTNRKFFDSVVVATRAALNDELRVKFEGGMMTKRDLRLRVAARCGIPSVTEEFKTAVAQAVEICLKEMEAAVSLVVNSP